MIKILVENEWEPRAYTNALINFLDECGEDVDNAIYNALYWMSDEDVREFARLQYEIDFVTSEEELEEEEF